MTASSERDELRSMVVDRISTGHCREDVVALSHLLLPARWFEEAVRVYAAFAEEFKLLGRGKTIPIAELACSWFEHLGFRADRTRQNLEGYPGLFRELLHPPPWVTVEPEDSQGAISPKRAEELRPLYTYADTPEDAIRLYETHRAEERESRRLLAKAVTKHATVLPVPGDLPAEAERVLVEDLKGKLQLARTLGISTFERVTEAVFGFDEFTPADGAPDLFVWDPSGPSTWFFAEVKGPKDRLRKTQYEWITSNWTYIEGHMMLVSICGSEKTPGRSAPR
ncbi:MAG: VRR-NUC domain-containing protein [Phycisphaerales bacterium]|nr:MAG: VRR-NUC domain-containing protein [Phycisphaerales bacterium]